MREFEEEGCAMADFAFGPHSSSVASHDALHSRQPDARTREFMLCVQPLEHAKQSMRVGHVEARALSRI
jgi:hypothetical protein